MKYLKLFLLLLTSSVANAQAIYSPDKQICFELLNQGGLLAYQVRFSGQPVIESSTMGYAASRMLVLNHYTVNQTYKWRGVHSRASNHYNGMLIRSKEFKLEVRAYNNGVAFRYLTPQVHDDRTTFTLPSGCITWSQDDIDYYEGAYQEQLVDTIPAGGNVGPPLTIKLPNNSGYAAITEAGVQNYAGMSLKTAGKRTYEAFVPETRIQGPAASPWRVVEIGKDLNALVNCDIITDVSPAPDKTLFPKGFAAEWLQPGECVWSWLANNGDVSLDNMKKYSKWAGLLGIPYNLVDAGWAKWKNHWSELKDLVDYSASQKVHIWVWQNYKDKDGIPGISDAEARWAFFSRCKAAGVAGIKIDFFNSESQEVLNWYQEALRDAAKLHLMLDFHGADKPTGQCRTWPNEMTREGVRGLEGDNNYPVHNTTVQFTRFLAGHADYTPFTLLTDLAKNTTLTHQVATVITFTSPFMCLGVDPEQLLKSPVRYFVTKLPTTWDETIVLPPSEIGHLSVFARRKRNTWYLAALNGETTQKFNISLSFLKSGNYRMTQLTDDPANRQKCSIANADINHNKTITLQLQPGGGYAAEFELK